MENYFGIVSIGLLAQLLFSARILVQWILSERAGRVLSPTIFWVLSLAASVLLCLYGWLRDDFSIVLGQFIGYYVYLWNLKLKGVMKQLPVVLKAVLLLLPVLVVVEVMDNAGDFVNTFFRNSNMPLWLLVWGISGQVIFTMRFVYQWYYSYRFGESVLPAAFWAISLAGSLLIVTYGMVRLDVVLILGQSFGIAAYSRNLYLWYHPVNRPTHEK